MKDVWWEMISSMTGLCFDEYKIPYFYFIYLFGKIKSLLLHTSADPTNQSALGTESLNGWDRRPVP